MNWTAEEARYALDHLVLRRKIRPADVDKALRDRKKEIQRIRERLAELESLAGALGTGRRAATKRRRTKRPPMRRKLRLSARVRSQLRLQGKYMGYVRRLTAAQKSQVRKVKEEKGWREAIKMASALAKAGAQKR